MKQKGLYGVLLATAIVYAIFAFLDCFYKIGLIIVGDSYYDRLAVEGMLGQTSKAMHWIYAIVLLVACVLFMIYNGKKALALVGGILMILQNVVALAWVVSVPVLIRTYHISFVIDYGPWIGLGIGLLYSISVILIALYYKDPVMELIAALVTMCQVIVFPFLSMLCRYGVLDSSSYNTYTIVVLIPMCILVIVYLFKWAKMSKI